METRDSIEYNLYEMPPKNISFNWKIINAGMWKLIQVVGMVY